MNAARAALHARSADGALTRRDRLIILATCCLSLFIVGLDVSAVNVALPSISSDLGATPSQLQWILDSYALVIASLLIFGGSLGDRLGRKRIFQVGLVTFGLASVLCSLAPTPEILIGARMLQAVGGAMLNPVALSIVTNVFVDPRERAQAIGLWGTAFGMSLAFGPVLGGALVSGIGWEAIFWLNVPVCLLALALTMRFVPESKAERARRADPIGQVLILTFLATLTFAIIEGRPLGWTSPAVLACFVVSAGALVAMVVYESRRVEPLLDPRFFRSVPFSSAVACAVIAFAATGGFLFLNTLYLQEVRGMSPFNAGLMTLPMAASSVVCAPIAGRLVGDRGARTPMAIGGVAMVAGSLMLTGLGNDTALVYVGAAYLVFGLGFGFMNAPITNGAVSGMPRTQAGLASAMASTGRQVGTALGVAVFGAVAFAGIDGSVADGLAVAARPVWLIMALCGAAILVLAFVSTGAWARGTAVRTRERIESTSGTWMP
ncbi:MFS transporter [Gordonia westfalica]|uniref:Drug resistance transporter, EmrB/QacA subfamily n=1 Tax=Gordonia westfalica TaxID=158898 RepID=A0A1H2HHA7_9ACTN|nr:MFS transporter [Gordonia westfalica]SDU31109.1 drug resistance transporter, EmrB/QacA subfamily [Gordonia westfalica]